jgi:NAD(P)-dependent dehydrogenase (short-subunit alcohol dehydrogenase family)
MVIIGRTDPTASSNNPNLPLRRPGLASEAAGSMLLLALPYSSYITGHTLEVTGIFCWSLVAVGGRVEFDSNRRHCN